MKTPSHNQGFTLIETLVAISILVVAVLGPMAMLSEAISNSAYVKNQVTATYLAQEGLEFVVNKRDFIRSTWPEPLEEPAPGTAYEDGENWLIGQDPDLGLTPCLKSYCQVDTIDWVITRSCGSELCAAKLLKSGDNLYGYTNGEETIFTRSVYVEPIVSQNPDTGDDETNEAKVRVQMKWMDKNNERDFQLETIITKK